MNKIFFTPGPSELYPTLKKHILRALELQIPSISHRGSAFAAISKKAKDGLRRLMHIPDSHRIYFISSGTEAMERVIENCVEKQSFHFVNGAFAKRFYQTAKELNKSPKMHEVPIGESFDMQKTPIPKSAELLCFTQNETSSGVAIPMEQIYALKRKNPKKLIALDVVSSAPYVTIDFKRIDVTFFSVQKGFGLPAGLGILIVSPKALAKARSLSEKLVSIGSYHSFLSLEATGVKEQTPETPNVLGLYLLGEVIADMLSVGIEKIRKETEKKATLLYDFFDKQKIYKPFVKDRRFRSQTVIVVQIPDGSKSIIEKLKKERIIIGSGYGEQKDTQIRISNFPANKLSDMKKLLSFFRNLHSNYN